MTGKVEEFLDGLRAGEPHAVEAANRLLGTMARTQPPGYGKELTARQNQMVEYLACGFTTQQIAFELGLSVETVKGHLVKAKGKLGALTQPHLVALWLTRLGSDAVRTRV